MKRSRRLTVRDWHERKKLSKAAAHWLRDAEEKRSIKERSSRIIEVISIKVVRPTQLAKLASVDVETIWQWINDGALPRPIKMGGIRAWPETHIHELINCLQELVQSRREGQ